MPALSFSYTTFVFLNTTCLDLSFRIFPRFAFVWLDDVAAFFLLVRNDNEGWSDSNNSNFVSVSIIQMLERKNVLPYGKYIEYKSCQINKINVVPITIIFKQR